MPVIPLHIASLFIALVFGIAFLIIISVHVCGKRAELPFEAKRKNLTITIIFLLFWLVYTLVIASSGRLADFNALPPRLPLVTLPPLLIIIFLAFSKGFTTLSAHLDNFWLVYVQSFRILMEFILWLLYRHNLIPVQMTYEGRNFDIITGITAPFIAYYCFNRKSWSPKVAIVWNVMGLLLLANIVATAILSTPYPFRYFMNEPANIIIFYFPFVWLPSVVVPFALLLHIMSLKRLLASPGSTPQV